MTPWPRLGTAVLVLGSLSGCSSAELNGNVDDTAQEGDDTSDSDDTAPTDDDGAEPPSPSWIRVDGTLQVTGGVPEPTGTTIAIEYVLDAADESDEPVDTEDTGLDSGLIAPCTRTPAVVAFTPGTSPDAAITLGWWTLTLDASDDPGCSFSLPAGLSLGVGELDPQLYAAMDLAGMATTEGQLNGLYIRLGGDSEPVWVYGVVGTAGQYAGSAPVLTAPPLPDGAYTLQALHLLPFVPGP